MVRAFVVIVGMIVATLAVRFAPWAAWWAAFTSELGYLITIAMMWLLVYVVLPILLFRRRVDPWMGYGPWGPQLDHPEYRWQDFMLGPLRGGLGFNLPGGLNIGGAGVSFGGDWFGGGGSFGGGGATGRW